MDNGGGIQGRRKILNSIPIQALLDGTVFSDHPESYTSRYSAADPPPARYTWDTYLYYHTASKQELNMVTAMTEKIQGRIPEQGNSPVIRAIAGATVDRQTYETIAPLRLSRALEHALKAAIAGTGSIPKTHPTLQELSETLRSLAPKEDLTTRISLREYQKTTLLRGMSIEHAVESSTHDVEKFRKLATRLRTRTTREANARDRKAGPPF